MPVQARDRSAKRVSASVSAWRTTQLAIDRQPGDAVHDRPDEARELQRVVATHQPALLQRDQRVDEDVERARRLRHQLRVGRMRRERNPPNITR